MQALNEFELQNIAGGKGGSAKWRFKFNFQRVAGQVETYLSTESYDSQSKADTEGRSVMATYPSATGFMTFEER